MTETTAHVTFRNGNWILHLIPQDIDAIHHHWTCTTCLEAITRAKEILSRLGGGIILAHPADGRDTESITVRTGYYPPVLVPTPLEWFTGTR